MENILSVTQIVVGLSVAYVWTFRYDNVVKEFKQFGLNDLTRNLVGVSKIGDYPEKCVNRIQGGYSFRRFSNKIINWFRMMPQSRMGMVHFLVASWTARKTDFMTASSLG